MPTTTYVLEDLRIDATPDPLDESYLYEFIGPRGDILATSVGAPEGGERFGTSAGLRSALYVAFEDNLSRDTRRAIEEYMGLRANFDGMEKVTRGKTPMPKRGQGLDYAEAMRGRGEAAGRRRAAQTIQWLDGDRMTAQDVARLEYFGREAAQREGVRTVAVRDWFLDGFRRAASDAVKAYRGQTRARPNGRRSTKSRKQSGHPRPSPKGIARGRRTRRTQGQRKRR